VGVCLVSAGWMPGYLFLNATGPKKYRVREHADAASRSPHVNLGLV
jgi:hypothetical protein